MSYKGVIKMIKSKKKYKTKVRRMYVDFYLKDTDIYVYAQSVNFQRLVKNALREAIEYDMINTEEEQNNAIVQER